MSANSTITNDSKLLESFDDLELAETPLNSQYDDGSETGLSYVAIQKRKNAFSSKWRVIKVMIAVSAVVGALGYVQDVMITSHKLDAHSTGRRMQSATAEPIPVNAQEQTGIPMELNIQPILDFWGGLNTDKWCQYSEPGAVKIVCCGEDCLSLSGRSARIVYSPDSPEQPINVFIRLGEDASLDRFCFDQQEKITNIEKNRNFQQCNQDMDGLFRNNPRDTFIYQNYATDRVIFSPASLSVGSKDPTGLDTSNLFNSNAEYKWRYFEDNSQFPMRYYFRNELTMEYLGSNEYGYLYTKSKEEIISENNVDPYSWEYQQVPCPDEMRYGDTWSCSTFRNRFLKNGAQRDDVLLDLPGPSPDQYQTARTVPRNSEQHNALEDNALWRVLRVPSNDK